MEDCAKFDHYPRNSITGPYFCENIAPLWTDNNEMSEYWAIIHQDYRTLSFAFPWARWC